MRLSVSRLAGLLAVLLLSLSVSLTAYAVDAKLNTDDKCAAKCDEEADKCTQHAGKDASKQRDCDTAYEMCLRQCG